MKGDVVALGRTAEVLDWGDGRVLKLFYAWCPPAWADREARAARFIDGLGLPAPALLDEVAIEGRRGLVYERVDGPNLLDALFADLSQAPTLIGQLGALHAEMHRRRAPGLDAIKDALRWSIERAEITVAIRDAALARLVALPDGDCLLHFDFHPQQVLVTARGPIILDWITAARGHPLADVARTSMLFRVSAKPGGSAAEMAVIDAQRAALLGHYLAAYFAARPDLDRQMLDQWLLPVAVTRLEEDIAGEREPLLSIIEERL